ncbi:MAG TPA: RluA family pseudouridine synthase [Bacteroidales bacterium]|jgi:23S rRNA pseudouridine1911/1915/1917 synthase|nr:RluA family pseudouridine synthase [Bacteroidales bacterium]HRS19244.1 RluA family pseudouridine synthase [Bacteroidales bacterium]
MFVDVLYEDNHVIIVNKATNVLVQSDTTGDTSLEDAVKLYIKEKYNKPGEVFLGVIHRIDRPVSGVVLFAKTSKALTRLNEQLKKKEFKKTYRAIVKQKPIPESSILKHYIVRNPKINKSIAYDKPTADAKEASLAYRTIAQSQNYYLLDIDLHTGRHHQIRCQLAKIGCPIKGDLKYGFARSNQNGGISLHAYSLTFVHPVSKEEISVIAPLPHDDIWHVF